MDQFQTGQQNLKLWRCLMKAKSFAFGLFFILLSSLTFAATDEFCGGAIEFRKIAGVDSTGKTGRGSQGPV